MLNSLIKKGKQQFFKYANLNNPIATKFYINTYSPYVGAGVRVDEIDYDKGMIRVSMPLTWRNKNIVGTQFGGSLYSMTDPFFMTLLMQKLGQEYMVWDKSAHIDFIKAGTSDVFATFNIDDDEVNTIKELAKDGKAVFRDYEVDIVDVNNEVIAKVKKTLYIRLRAFSKSAKFVSRF
ncbi:DUF4442 domain-containing protein [Moraxella oblonga]|uniref:DUF4442 domain-containing protein n=1 Tax=Moraxella oblonga TaxID=200413 RepID=UPI00083125A7|nr:DUF4442 domain-containing protein [Moraxella oblonga]